MNSSSKNVEMTQEERATLIFSKKRAFHDADKRCGAEFDMFGPCVKCKFLSQDCHKTCGVIMKHVNRI